MVVRMRDMLTTGVSEGVSVCHLAFIVVNQIYSTVAKCSQNAGTSRSRGRGLGRGRGRVWGFFFSQSFFCSNQFVVILLGPVARSPVSTNRWLRGIKTNMFPWYQKPIRVETCNSRLCAGKQASEYSIC